MAAVVLYFRADLMRIARAWLASLRDAVAPLGARRAHGLVPHPRHGPDRRSSAFAFSRSDRERRAQTCTSSARRSSCSGCCCSSPRRSRAASATLDEHHAPRRDRHRLRPGARADPRRLALGRDDHRRPVPRLRPRRRGALLVSAVDPGGRAERPLRAARRRRRQRRGRRRASAPTAVATLLAFISGYVSIAFLLRFLTTHTTAVFVAYRVVLGVVGARARRDRHDRLSAQATAKV